MAVRFSEGKLDKLTMTKIKIMSNFVYDRCIGFF